MTSDPFQGWTDEQLLNASALGREDAFVEIYRRHHDRVYRFTYRMTGSAEAAADITHICFVSLIEAPRRFSQGRAALGTYLCAAARNQSLKLLRNTCREIIDSDSLSEMRGRELNPLDLFLNDEKGRVVRDAVLALAPLHREVVVLAEYEEMDLATIAAVVGADVGAVKVRLHRARKKLRGMLEGYVKGGAIALPARK